MAASNDFARFDGDNRLTTLIPDMNVWRVMIPPIHLHDEAEEN
jgi:hypothetical protein